jgi:hypothetical protein
MRWTACYGFMTTCLAGVIGYSMYISPTSARHAAQRFDDAFGLNGSARATCPPSACLATPAVTPKAPAITSAAPNRVAAEPAQAETAAAVALAIDSLEVGAGRDVVRAMLGSPTSSSRDERVWTYGSRAVVFSDDKVVGWMEVDPSVAEMMAPSADALLAGSARAGGMTAAQARAAKAARGSRVPAKPIKARSGRKPRYAYEPMFKAAGLNLPRFRQPDWLRAWSKFRDRQRVLYNRALHSGNGRYTDAYGRSVVPGRVINKKSNRRTSR